MFYLAHAISNGLVQVYSAETELALFEEFVRDIDGDSAAIARGRIAGYAIDGRDVWVEADPLDFWKTHAARTFEDRDNEDYFWGEDEAKVRRQAQAFFDGTLGDE